MAEILRRIIHAESEAQRIIDEAKAEAEKILAETEKKKNDVYETTYKETIDKSKSKLTDRERRLTDSTQTRIDKLLLSAEIEVKTIRKKAHERFDKAADAVLERIFP